VVNVVKEQRALSGHARWAGHARGGVAHDKPALEALHPLSVGLGPVYMCMCRSMYLGTAKSVIQIRWKNQKQVLKKCIKIITMVKLKL